jgi:hypothetical protein
MTNGLTYPDSFSFLLLTYVGQLYDEIGFFTLINYPNESQELLGLHFSKLELNERVAILNLRRKL